MTGRASHSPGCPAIGSTHPPALRNLRVLLLGATRSLSYQFARYLVVGGLAFAVDFGSLYLLTEFAGLHYLLSAAVAFLFGLAANYCLSRLWVFDRRTMENVAMEFLVFTVIGVVGLGLTEGLIWLLSEKMHVYYMVAKTGSAGVVLVWNFGARKIILFR